jgi:PAS domain S-box-containing protein
VLYTNPIILQILDRLETPLFIVNRAGKVSWKNATAKIKIFENLNSLDWSYIFPLLPEHYAYRVYENLDEEGHLLIEGLYHATDTGAISELTTLLDFAYDEWFLTDGQGITLEVNTAAERLYDIRREEIIGKSIFELEKNHVFYPSVTAMVLRHRRAQTILQTTRSGRKLISTGTPLFNEAGMIYRVISNSKDITDFHLFKAAKEDVKLQVSTHDIKTNSPMMAKTLEAAQRVASTDATVLLLGETGVGKNNLAKYIHARSSRKYGSCIEINCAAIPEALLESELFGYESGAFTGARRQGKKGKVELANGGTLFLNEIAELPLHLQGKLLDVLQDRVISRIGSTEYVAVNFRVVAATNRNLEKMVEEGKFRQDLFYRLHVFPITIPPLRERLEDMETLVNEFLKLFTTRYQIENIQLTPDAFQTLKAYEWPGNIRELENLMERITILNPNTKISANELIDLLPTQVKFSSTDLKSRVNEFESQIFQEAAMRYRTTYEIAEYLHTSQATVVRKLKQFAITLR